MTKTTTLILTFFFAAELLAQNVTGKLTDEKGIALPFANVGLHSSPGEKLVKTAITDSAGRFILPEIGSGSYFLKVTAIGFLEKTTEVFTLDNGSSKEFSNIIINPDPKTLKDVTVTALRPTVIQKADRMIVNVEGTAMAAGTNAYTVLSKAPGIFIDQEGNIQLNGRAGVTVQIDGRPTYLSARDLRTYLEGMSAENIKNLEIITNPSAKQDAEGTAGIINLNLKKNTQQGINGSIYFSYSYNFKQHPFSGGGNINFKSGKWNSFLNMDFTKRLGGREATFTRIFYAPAKTTYFDQVAEGNFEAMGPPSVRFGTDYSFNKNHSIGMMAYVNRNTADIEFLTDTWIGEAPHNPVQYIDANNFTHNTFTNFTSNFHYVGKLDTLGSQFTSDLDYVKITNRGESNFYNLFRNLSTNQDSTDQLYTLTPNGYEIYSARIDYTKQFQSQKIETGARVSRVTSDNDFRFFFNNGRLEIDPLRTNHFNYVENIYAGYLNWSGDLSKKINLQAGLRGEQTKSTGTSFTTGQVTNRSYFDLFPSIFIQQKVTDNYGINYSYSRRLSRPNYGNLNPFRSYRDPYTWIEGNPHLRPAYTHSFSIAQTFRKVYILTASYQLSKDINSEIPILDVANGVTIYTTGNINDGYNYSLTGVGPLKITKKWDSQNTLLVSYNKLSMESNNGLQVNDQVFFMLQTNHTILLPKDIKMEMNFLFRGPAAGGLYHMASMHRLDFAWKKSFFKKKFDVTLNANDVFAGWRFLWTTDINGNVNEFDQYFRFRSLGFSLRYNFSKGQKTDQRKTNTLEEVNRTGG